MPTRERRAKMLGIPVNQLPDGRGKGRKASGSKHYRWNAEKIISSHGYVKIRVGVGHPLADKNGYAYEHHVVWRNAGRQLPERNQVIHHRNEDKTDNQLGNLELLTKREHADEHHMMVSDSAVREIRVRYAAGEKGTDLAKEFNLPYQRIYRFIHGETRLGAGGPVQSGGLRGKKVAGRLLDGVQHDGYPEVQP